jgi:hypothetical protein
MKPRTSVVLLILLSGMLLAVVGQWRVATRLQEENRDLRRTNRELEEKRAEAERRTQASAREAAEAGPSIQEAISLRAELQTVRQELERAKASVAPRAPGSPSLLTGSLTDGTRPLDAVPQAQYAARSPTFSRMLPGAYTNLNARGLEDSAYHKGGGTINGVSVWNCISKEDALSGPDWAPSQPLPLSFPSAEEIARGELRKLVQDEHMWGVDSISLNHSRDYPQKWHYMVGLRAPYGNGYLIVNVGMGGTPGTTVIASRAP